MKRAIQKADRRLAALLLVSTSLTFLSCQTLSSASGEALDQPQFEAASPMAPLGCSTFPNDNIWNTRIDNLSGHPLSSEWIETIGRDESFHADFGSGVWPPVSGGPIGIPFTPIDSTTAFVEVEFDYANESDPGPYPIPQDALIEGGPQSDGDRHILLLDPGACILYELYHAYPGQNGHWKAGSGAIFDLRSNALRPEGWTSADAAGLPIYPGLVRYDEVAAGEINHAIRFTAPETRNAYVWPARHFASDLTETQFPPMGQRFRLHADYNIEGFNPDVQVILRAMQRYGIILADNGSSWYISGAPDERWDNDVLRQLSRLQGHDFEAVDVSSLMLDPNSGQTGHLDQSAFLPAVVVSMKHR